MTAPARVASEQRAAGLNFRYKALMLFASVVAVVTVQYLVRAQRMTETTNTLYRINKHRREIAEEKNVNAQLKCALAKLQRPDDVLRKLRENGICLAPAPLERVVHVALPVTVEGMPEEQPSPPARAPLIPRTGPLLASTRPEGKQ